MSVLCAAAPDGNTLIFARALQGVTGALLTPAGLAVITATFKGEERGAAIGMWTSWTGIAFVVGPLVGGWLVSHTSWRWVFIINIPFAVATAALVWLVVPVIARDGPRPRVDSSVRCSARSGSRSRLRPDRGAEAGLRRPVDPADAVRRLRPLRRVPDLGANELPLDAPAPALQTPELHVHQFETLTVYAGCRR